MHRWLNHKHRCTLIQLAAHPLPSVSLHQVVAPVARYVPSFLVDLTDRQPLSGVTVDTDTSWYSLTSLRYDPHPSNFSCNMPPSILPFPSIRGFLRQPEPRHLFRGEVGRTRAKVVCSRHEDDFASPHTSGCWPRLSVRKRKMC